MKHGSLLEFLCHGEGKYITMHQVIDMIAQIAGGKQIRWSGVRGLGWWGGGGGGWGRLAGVAKTVYSLCRHHT